MKLCEHPEFVQAILRASEHFRSRGLRPALIEKDYYVTETLRLIARGRRPGDLQGRDELFEGLEPDPALFRGHRHLSGPSRVRARTAGVARSTGN
jgi:hypothetical protein